MDADARNTVRPRLVRPAFPRSATCDLVWMLANPMGPNAVWLRGWVDGLLRLEPGMQVLDLRCGNGLDTSSMSTPAPDDFPPVGGGQHSATRRGRRRPVSASPCTVSAATAGAGILLLLLLLLPVAGARRAGFGKPIEGHALFA